MNTRNIVRVALALAAAAAVGAACGVANPFTPAVANSSRQDQLLKFAQCMRQHGIDVPDPVNGRITISATPAPGQTGQTGPTANGPTEGNPQLQAAQDACKQYLPNGGSGSRQPTQQQLDQAAKFAQCMRDHGIPMQDPTVQGGGIRFGGGGPGIDPSSQQFQQAQQACQKYAPGGGGKTTTSSGAGSGTQAAGGGNG